MARCKLTNMNLRNIRKSREYQCLLIDLVKTGIVGKSAAEGLLGYTIPEGLLGDTTPVTPSDEDEDDPRLITIVSMSQIGRDVTYDSFTYDLNDGETAEDVLAAANDHWPLGDASNGDPFNTINSLVENDGGDVTVGTKRYNVVIGVVESFEPGAAYEVLYIAPSDEENG